jgi:hypothetical protein
MLRRSISILQRNAIILTNKIRAVGIQQEGGTWWLCFMYVFLVVCCVLLCVLEAVGSWVSAIGS